MNYTFDIDLAKKYGVDEAIMLQNFIYWIAYNKANNQHEHEGRTWTYNSARAFADLFPFWSEKQVYRIITSLIQQDVLIVGNFNQVKYDQTRWYAFTDESIFLDGNYHFTKRGNRIPDTGEPIPDIKPDIKPDNTNVESKQEDIPKKKLPTEATTLANLLYDLHKAQVDKKYVVPPNQLLKWSEEIEKLHRLNNRSWGEIEMVIRWCKNDDFWKSNIMSGGTLRKQFPKLITRIPKAKPPTPQFDELPKQCRPPFNSYCMAQVVKRDSGQSYDSELLDLIFGDDQDKIDEAETRYQTSGNWKDEATPFDGVRGKA